MNREQLIKLIDDTLEIYRQPHALVDALWPVLAQVWEEGRNDALNSGLWTPNPYGEVPR